MSSPSSIEKEWFFDRSSPVFECEAGSESTGGNKGDEKDKSPINNEWFFGTEEEILCSQGGVVSEDDIQGSVRLSTIAELTERSMSTTDVSHCETGNAPHASFADLPSSDSLVPSLASSLRMTASNFSSETSLLDNQYHHERKFAKKHPSKMRRENLSFRGEIPRPQPRQSRKPHTSNQILRRDAPRAPPIRHQDHAHRYQDHAPRGRHGEWPVPAQDVVIFDGPHAFHATGTDVYEMKPGVFMDTVGRPVQVVPYDATPLSVDGRGLIPKPPEDDVCEGDTLRAVRIKHRRRSPFLTLDALRQMGYGEDVEEMMVAGRGGGPARYGRNKEASAVAVDTTDGGYGSYTGTSVDDANAHKTYFKPPSANDTYNGVPVENARGYETYNDAPVEYARVYETYNDAPVKLDQLMFSGDTYKTYPNKPAVVPPIRHSMPSKARCVPKPNKDGCCTKNVSPGVDSDWFFNHRKVDRQPVSALSEYNFRNDKLSFVPVSEPIRNNVVQKKQKGFALSGKRAHIHSESVSSKDVKYDVTISVVVDANETPTPSVLGKLPAVSMKELYTPAPLPHIDQLMFSGDANETPTPNLTQEDEQTRDIYQLKNSQVRPKCGCATGEDHNLHVNSPLPPLADVPSQYWPWMQKPLSEIKDKTSLNKKEDQHPRARCEDHRASGDEGEGHKTSDNKGEGHRANNDKGEGYRASGDESEGYRANCDESEVNGSMVGRQEFNPGLSIKKTKCVSCKGVLAFVNESGDHEIKAGEDIHGKMNKLKEDDKSKTHNKLKFCYYSRGVGVFIDKLGTYVDVDGQPVSTHKRRRQSDPSVTAKGDRELVKLLRGDLPTNFNFSSMDQGRHESILTDRDYYTPVPQSDGRSCGGNSKGKLHPIGGLVPDRYMRNLVDNFMLKRYRSIHSNKRASFVQHTAPVTPPSGRVMYNIKTGRAEEGLIRKNSITLTKERMSCGSSIYSHGRHPHGHGAQRNRYDQCVTQRHTRLHKAKERANIAHLKTSLFPWAKKSNQDVKNMSTTLQKPRKKSAIHFEEGTADIVKLVPIRNLDLTSLSYPGTKGIKHERPVKGFRTQFDKPAAQNTNIVRNEWKIRNYPHSQTSSRRATPHHSQRHSKDVDAESQASGGTDGSGISRTTKTSRATTVSSLKSTRRIISVKTTERKPFYEPLQLLRTGTTNETSLKGEVYLVPGPRDATNPKEDPRQTVNMPTVSVPRKGLIKLTGLPYEIDNPEYFDNRKERPAPEKMWDHTKFSYVAPPSSPEVLQGDCWAGACH